MDRAAIQVEGLGKQYRIGGRLERYRTLRDTVAEMALRPVRAMQSLRDRNGNSRRPFQESIWALRDVSFEVKAGEVVGIVGRNGAGKSTLLKILSRITIPTEGRANIRGRVASLLEVGTGFHPELTGRENIQLSGAILGMRRCEIGRRFDEIVAFAGVDHFIDTPLKHYSSGMQMRLAFAVAAHLEPGILLIDEVLTVGDMKFQKKCLGKMEAVSRGGRTILLVSHQMNQIRRLCHRCIWLERGHVERIGPAATVLDAYARELSRPVPAVAENDRQDVIFVNWEITHPADVQPNALRSHGPLTFVVTITIRRPIRSGEYNITLYDGDHRPIWGVSRDGLRLEPGTYWFAHTLTDLPLRPGVYFWQAGIHDGDQWWVWWGHPELIIETESRVYHRLDEYAGILNIPAQLDISRQPES